MNGRMDGKKERMDGKKERMDGKKRRRKEEKYLIGLRKSCNKILLNLIFYSNLK